MPGLKDMKLRIFGPLIQQQKNPAALAVKREAEEGIVMTEQAFMQRAVALALEKMRTNSGGPFGAVIVRNNKIISEGWNEVTSSNDPTAHAEIVAIRRACALLGAFNL